ncbi:hypothetical protein [Streptomyces sp. NPDC047972]|uniref:hypothetical protein n=1 Tax=Streptomyces sp. NPDC047972 TaxID=3365493 RepID=UPI003711F4E0
MTWFDHACTAAGCTSVPAELIRERYDGPSDLEAHRDKELIAALIAALAAAGEGVDHQDEAESAVGVACWNDRHPEYM